MCQEFGYDEASCVEFIRKKLPEDLRSKLKDEDIIYFDDLLYEYFVEKGYISLDDEDDEDDEGELVDIDVDELTNYMEKIIRMDGIVSVERNELILIIEADLAYMETLDLFE